ncbi:tyrosine-type recombinase/integrase [Acinetobacter calcoaceticus]|uniref:tyrosine-type recombinase/integrase n=1 Tax=Acinetobacter calcoaceticus TaxID=471 RepID=UPI003A8AD221
MNVNTIIFSTDREIQSLKAKEKRYTAKDKLNNGLFIDIKPTGRKTWMYRYTINKKQEKLTLGHYPAISLKDARQLRDEFATKIAKGIPPKQSTKTTQMQLSNFKSYGERYVNEVIAKDRTSTSTMQLYLNNDIYPIIGHLLISDITVDQIRQIIWSQKERGHDATAWQIRGLLSRMFDYAVTLGLVQYNIVSTIPAKHVYKYRPRERFLSYDEITNFYTTLLSMDRIQRPFQIGLLLSLLTLLRKSELISAKWVHIDFENRIWVVPKTKADSNTGNSREMIVFLSDQIITLLHELRNLNYSSSYLFAGKKIGTHISKATLNTVQEKVLLKSQIEPFTIHDLRRTASTHLNELGFLENAVEACLNHKIAGIKGIYNKAIYKTQRIEIMQKWSDRVFSLIEKSSTM